MDVISVTEAARILGLSRQRVLVLVRAGRIPAGRLDGSNVYTIKRSDLYKFIRTRNHLPVVIKKRSVQ